MNTPMTDDDMRRWLPGTPIILYPEFSKLHSIDDVLDTNGQCCFLYEWIPNDGHWCCMWKKGDTIHVFDPLGFYPDQELSHVVKRYRKQLKEDKPYLRDLLMKSPYKVVYNSFALQKKTTAVCGKECIVRLAFKHLNEYQYHAMWHGLQPDAIVAQVIT